MSATALAEHPEQDRPPEYPTTVCKSCPARVIFAILPNRDRIPVDADPVDPVRGGGTILLTSRGPTVPPWARKVANPAELFGKKWVYRSHFDTCPFADRHRGTASRPPATRRRPAWRRP